MEPLIIIKENWFTKPPNPRAVDFTALLALFVFGAAFAYLSEFRGVDQWMAASAQSVFGQGEYWRLWTTLFAHGDREHLVNNALLFFPLAYLLMAYFGTLLFPFIGLLMGGVVNWIVLQTLPASVSLIGMSGVVYWMGAAWFTLFILIDKRKNFKYRFGNVLFLVLMLFIPETYKPQVSYLSHFVGFVLGVFTALVFYWVHRARFESVEVREVIYDEDLENPFENETIYNRTI